MTKLIFVCALFTTELAALVITRMKTWKSCQVDINFQVQQQQQQHLQSSKWEEQWQLQFVVDK